MLTQERVRELFDYREDGALVWKVRNSNVISVGRVAGTDHGDGYVAIKADGVIYLGHRLVWLWHKGYLPEHGLDHRDRVRSNNRISNLREASHQCNARNTGNPCNNTSTVKGVSWNGRVRLWHAYIKVSQKRLHLGYHDTLLEAVCHRLAAEQAIDWVGCDSASPAFRYVEEHLKSMV